MVKIETLLLGGLLASGVLLSLTGMLGNLAIHYNFTGNSTTLEQLSLISGLESSGNTTYQTLQQGQMEQGSGSDVWTGVWTAIKQLLNLPVVFSGMISEVLGFNNILMLPSWVSLLVYAIIGVLITYAIFRTLRGGEV